MDEAGNHHPQQTDTRTENQTPHVLTHKRVLNNENTWTQRGNLYILGSIGWDQGRDIAGELGWIMWGEMPGTGDGEMAAGNHLAMYVPIQQSCVICTQTPYLKYNLKKLLKKGKSLCKIRSQLK